jgi:hypothetical protein
VWEHIGKEIKHTFIGSKALKNFNTLFCFNLSCVFDSDLCYNLNILSVGFEHIIHACQAILLTQFSEEIDDLILLNSVCVEHNSFDVLHVSVVLESTAIESNLFAHLSNLLAVVLSENVKFENSFSNIWGTHEIDLKNFSLKVSFVLSVTFKSF